MKRVTFISLAEQEIAEAAKYYEEHDPGVGRQFLDAIRDGLVVIQNNPERCAFYEKPVRSYRVRRFPFRILFRELADRIQVIAVVHLSRKPGYWAR